jgi:hypothetical protein
VRGDARHALHAHVCRVGTRTGTAEQRIKAARHTVQGGVHGWESMGRLLRPGTCAKITHIELRIEHRAPRLLPARCDAHAWPCLDFQALGRRRGDDDLQPDSARLHRSDALLGALQERTGPRRHLVGREARIRKPARFLIGGFGWFSVGRSWPLGTSLGTSLGQASVKLRKPRSSLPQAPLKPTSSLRQASGKLPQASRGGGLTEA